MPKTVKGGKTVSEIRKGYIIIMPRAKSDTAKSSAELDAEIRTIPNGC